SYVCLSHCWGGVSSTTLKRETVETFSKSIAIPSLPPTFLDAVAITKRLGYYYLWIDSLCIIQDPQDDWASQIPLMGEIYRHSAFKIAASKAKDSNGGCFTSRNSLAYSYCRLADLDAADDWFIGGQMGDIAFGPSSNDLKRLPLFTRGWVVQERTMSPRTLYFGSVMVHWEC
ncbi:heterokaryon incompatibility, partial [Setomelanomma holmii]